MAVLKDNRPNLLGDARTLFGVLPASVDLCTGKVRHRYWDSNRFTSWPELAPQVRVVRSLENRSVRRQLDKQEEELTSDWMWVTTLPQSEASTKAVVNMGHERWSIENQGFNELVNRWHADHVYKHHPAALLIFILFALLCLNVFMVFCRRNLKPAARRAVSMLHVAQLIASELYAAVTARPGHRSDDSGVSPIPRRLPEKPRRPRVPLRTPLPPQNRLANLLPTPFERKPLSYRAHTQALRNRCLCGRCPCPPWRSLYSLCARSLGAEPGQFDVGETIVDRT